MLGHIYSAPYASLEPTLSLVAEDSEGVAGFVVGTIDTLGWERRLEQDWWPSLRERYAMPPEDQKAVWSPDQRRAFMMHRPTQTPPGIAQDYPAHLHLNLLPRLQRRGLGTRLLDDWLRIARGYGADAIHVGVNQANTGGIHFWRKRGFADLVDDRWAGGRTVWLGRHN